MKKLKLLFIVKFLISKKKQKTVNILHRLAYKTKLFK